MLKPVTAVAFRADAPLISAFPAFIKTFATNNGPIPYMDCLRVSETSLGFLELVPKDAPDGEFGIYVPPGDILWMLRSVAENRPAFV